MNPDKMQQPGIIGIGAGGHCRVVMDLIRQQGVWQLHGVLDADPALHGNCLDGVPVLGDDSLLRDLRQQGIQTAFLGVGSIGNPAIRQKIHQRLLESGFCCPVLVHPKALVAQPVTMAPATCVMQGAILNPGCAIGTAAIINSGAIVEHDCQIGDFAHISPGAVLGGGVLVGDHSHVGIGATIRQGVRIGRNCLVGAGAVVVADVPDGATVCGLPARPFSPNPATVL